MPHWRAPWAPPISKPPASSKPRQTPSAPRPEWDDTITNVKQHALSDEDLERRRALYRSRNLIVISPPGRRPGTGDEAHGQARGEEHGEGAQTRPRSAPDGALLRPHRASLSSKPVRVDYAAVARQLAASATVRMQAAQVRARAQAQRAFDRGPEVQRRAHVAADGGDGDDVDPGDSVSEYSDSGDSAASREQLRSQLNDLRDIVRVMVRGLRACDAAQMAIRDEVAVQHAGLSKLKGLATLRADLESRHAQLQSRVATLERMLGQATAGGGEPTATGPAERTLGRVRADVRVTPARSQPRRVRFAVPLAAPASRDAMRDVVPAVGASMMHSGPAPPVGDDDLFTTASNGGTLQLPSYAELRALAAPSLPAELRLAGELPTGPAPALSGASWRFTTALAAPEPPRPVATAPLPSVARQASRSGFQPRDWLRPGLEDSVSLAQHAGLT